MDFFGVSFSFSPTLAHRTICHSALLTTLITLTHFRIQLCIIVCSVTKAASFLGRSLQRLFLACSFISACAYISGCFNVIVSVVVLGLYPCCCVIPLSSLVFTTVTMLLRIWLDSFLFVSVNRIRENSWSACRRVVRVSFDLRRLSTTAAGAAGLALVCLHGGH